MAAAVTANDSEGARSSFELFTGKSLRGGIEYCKKHFSSEALQLGSFNPTEKLKSMWIDKENVQNISPMMLCYFLGADPTELEENERNDSEYYREFLNHIKNFWNQEHNSEYQIMEHAMRPSKIFAVSLDGGGIRGLVSATTLRFVSNYCFGNDKHIDKRFQWFIGTSTGGIIALSVTKALKRTPTECVQLYWRMKDSVFIQSKAPDFFNKLTHRLATKQTKNLLNILKKDELGEMQKFKRATIEQTINGTEFIPRVAVIALDKTMDPGSREVFRNYQYETENSGNTGITQLPLWKVAQATSAAPTYFKPCRVFCPIERKVKKYVDGGLIANCPLPVLFSQFDDVDQHWDKQKKIAGILSIGTGHRRPTWRITSNRVRGTITLLQQQATGDDETHVADAIKRCNNNEIQLLRLSPDGIDVSLDELGIGKLIGMLWETHFYLCEDKLDDIDGFAKIYHQHLESC